MTHLVADSICHDVRPSRSDIPARDPLTLIAYSGDREQ